MRIVTFSLLLAIARALTASCPSQVFTQIASVPGPSGSTALAVADFNGDGTMDIARPSQVTDDVTVVLGNGDGTFRAGVAYASGGTDALGITAADFNNDGHPDLATLLYDPPEVAVFLNQGDGTFGVARRMAVPTTPHALETGDVDGDGKVDLIVTGWSEVGILRGLGDGTFSSVESIGSGLGVLVAAAAGDLNNDERDEVIVLVSAYQGSLPGKLAIYSRGLSGFEPPQFVPGMPAYSYDDRLVIADLDRNGPPDVVTTNRNEKQVLVFLNSGTGTLGAPIVSVLPAMPVVLKAADITQDGVPDLVFTPNRPVIDLLIGNGDGSFTGAFDNPSPQLTSPNDVAVADADGDGKLDLWFCNATDGTVILKNFCPSLTTITTAFSNMNSSFYREDVTFTATVTAEDGGEVTGQILWYDGPTFLAATKLPPSPPYQVSYWEESLAVGEHTIVAKYSGSATYQQSSGSIAHSVTQPPFGPPVRFSALGAGGGTLVFWLTTQESGGVEISRMCSNRAWTVVALTTANAPYEDRQVTAGSGCFYRLRAVRAGSPGTFSDYTAADAASIVNFDVPHVGSRIQHFYLEELRRAVNKLRVAVALPEAQYTDPYPWFIGGTVKAIHMTELRDALVAAMSAAGANPPTFAPIVGRETVIKASDFTQIIDAMQ